MCDHDTTFMYVCKAPHASYCTTSCLKKLFSFHELLQLFTFPGVVNPLTLDWIEMKLISGELELD